ncbi:MAG: 6-phosphofructokinase [Acidobacteria bacterium]|nr:MAG: 6-phosphofructokinase [Acidobacteriota bacterium]
MVNFGKIGILNGGGDCPGLNAVTRAVVRAATYRYGGQVMGIFDSFDGLIWPEKMKEFTPHQVRGILHEGGTILGTTSRGNPFNYHEEQDGKVVVHDYSRRVIENFQAANLQALVVVGGDGTLTIARDLFRLGVPVIGVPKTIDNDLSATDTTFGFRTAVNTATDAIDKIHTTAASHGRIMVIEVMGRDAGWIALEAGLAGGADVILIPEISFRLEKVFEKIQERKAAGKKFSLIVVAEGCRVEADDPVWLAHAHEGQFSVPLSAGNKIGALIGRERKEEVRVTVLGHLQRGGSPTPSDRILSTCFGVAAVELAARQEYGRMVCLKGNVITSCTLDEAVGRIKTVPPDSHIIQSARAIGVSFGAD